MSTKSRARRADNRQEKTPGDEPQALMMGSWCLPHQRESEQTAASGKNLAAVVLMQVKNERIVRAELLALAPGARCRLGRSVGSGAPQAGPLTMQWTAIGRFQQSSRSMPGTSEIRRECWSRGRIVSALLSGAQGGCLPSVEPPNRLNPPSAFQAPRAMGVDAHCLTPRDEATSSQSSLWTPLWILLWIAALACRRAPATLSVARVSPGKLPGADFLTTLAMASSRQLKPTT
jgi:hypothetical protein